MVTRAVPSYAGTQAAARAVDQQAEQQNQQTTVFLPEDVLRRAHANSIAGVIDQIAQVAEHALDIFTELRADSDHLNERFSGLVDRVATLAAAVLDGDVSAKQRLPTEEVSDHVLHVPELSFMAQPRAMSKPTQAAYDRCEPLPPFEVLAEFCPDISQYRKKYSNPEFFKEDWMQRETFRQQHAQEQREERRRHRKEQRKSLALGIAGVVGTGTNQNEDTAAPADTESEKERLAIQQKMKFLNIRSWKERYGTGEGKELLKPPTPRDKQLPPALSTSNEKKKRRSLTRKSLSFVKENEEDAKGSGGEIQPGSPVALSPAKDDGSEHKALEPMVGNNDAPVYSGAFMQEIEDPGDDLEDEYSGQQASTPVYGGVPSFTGQIDEPTVFADQGLSYYDPHVVNGAPPPPPAQTLMDEDLEYEEEDSWSTGQPPPSSPPQPHSVVYSQEYEDIEDFLPPPPPPPPPPEPTEPSTTDFLAARRRGSFVPPPPPPTTTTPVEQLRSPIVVRMPSLLQELQYKKSELRHVQDTGVDEAQPPPPPPPPPGGIISPRMNLLQQIRAQQLRPVGPPRPRDPVPRSSSQSTPHLSAPFASSIARILERRNMTAYDSDTSDKSDGGEESGSESEWK